MIILKNNIEVQSICYCSSSFAHPIGGSQCLQYNRQTFFQLHKDFLLQNEIWKKNWRSFVHTRRTYCHFSYTSAEKFFIYNSRLVQNCPDFEFPVIFPFFTFILSLSLMNRRYSLKDVDQGKKLEVVCPYKTNILPLQLHIGREIFHLQLQVSSELP